MNTDGFSVLILTVFSSSAGVDLVNHTARNIRSILNKQTSGAFLIFGCRDRGTQLLREEITALLLLKNAASVSEP